MSGMRIALLGGSLEGGGAQRFALRLADAMVAAGHDVWLISLDATCDFELGDYPSLQGRFVWLSRADVHRGTLRKVVDAPLQAWRLLRLLRSKRIDTVLSLQERSNILSMLLPGNMRRIISIRSYPAAMLQQKEPLKRWLVECLYGRLLHRADRIVLNSLDAADNFVELFHADPERVEVIYNICDAEDLHQRAVETTVEDIVPGLAGPMVLCTGRMVAEKGQPQLLRAFARVIERHPEATLVLAGKGPLEHRLRGLASKLGIAHQVVFAGFVNNVAPLLAAASVFVLPSRREGFPNALLEAVVMGCPSVACDCHSGPRELFSGQTAEHAVTEGIEKHPFGWLVPRLVGDDMPAAGAPLTAPEAAIADAIIQLLDDELARRGLQVRGRARAADFAPDQIIPMWLNALERPGLVAAPGY